MKLTTILLLISLFKIQANTYAQSTKISINLKEVSIEKVLNTIEAETEFNFLANIKEIDLNRKVSIKVNKKPISYVLEQIFKGTNVSYEVHKKQIILKPSKTTKSNKGTVPRTVAQQEIEVSGTVTDEAGVVLPGVNVVVSGTTNGTQTDFDGNYTITTTEGSILLFSYIGMGTKEITVGSNTTVNVTLQTSENALDEVVVTALGIKREKKALGYSVTELQGDEISEVKSNNALNSLAGKVAGVQINTSANGIGASTRVIIRGSNSFSGNNQPLYVIDGIPMRSSSSDVDYGDEFSGSSELDNGNDHAANINPDDIESLSVLKGPSAAALYGSRAANGVIVITTKKGKSNTGLGVTINSSLTIETPYIYPRYQDEFGPGRGGDISGKRWNIDPNLAYYDTNGIEINRIGDDKSWGARLNGQTYRQWDSQYTLAKYSPNPTFAQDFYTTGITQNNSISIDGGSENTTVRGAVTHLNSAGIVPESGQNRTTVSLRLNTKIADKLTLDGKITYVNQVVKNRTASSGRSSIPWILNMMQRGIANEFLEDFLNPEHNPATWPPEGITPYIVSQERRDPADPAYLGVWDPLGPKAPWVGNPYWLVKNHTNRDERNNYSGFISLKYDFNSNLSAMARVGLDQSNVFQEQKNASGALRLSNLGRYRVDTDFYSDLNADFLISYNKKLGDDFSFTTNVGGNHFSSRSRSTDSTGERFIIPNFFALNNFEEVTDGNLTKTRYDVNSLYFSTQLGYKNYAYLDITGRNDWSSTLPEENRSFFYPSIAGSFIFTDAFGIASDVLSFGKLRASWAEVGNGTDPYRLVSGINSGRFGSQLIVGLDDEIPLASLKPEKTSSIEFGTDLRFFRNRLNLDFTWYKSNTINQIVPIGVAKSTGFNTRIVNAGDIENKGFEILLGGTPIETKDFSWDASINFTKNKSEVIEVLSDQDVNFVEIDFIGLSGNNGLSFRAVKGQPYGAIYGRKFQRNSEGLVIVDKNGIPQGTNEQVFLGDPNPDWSAGIKNTFRYKNFKLGFLIDIRKGGLIVNNTLRTMNRAGTHQQSVAGRDDFYNTPEFLSLTTGSTRSSLPGSVNGGVNNWTNNNAVVQDKNLPINANGDQIGGVINTFHASPRIYHERIFNEGIAEPFLEDASFVKLREFSLGYTLPSKSLEKLPFTSVALSIIGRNLFIFHRNTKDFDPESNVSSGNVQGLEGNSLPGTRSFGFNVKLGL